MTSDRHISSVSSLIINTKFTTGSLQASIMGHLVYIIYLMILSPERFTRRARPIYISISSHAGLVNVGLSETSQCQSGLSETSLCLSGQS